MKWKKENKTKVEAGEDGEGSPEPPNMWSEADISWTNVLGSLTDWEKAASGLEVVFTIFVSILEYPHSSVVIQASDVFWLETAH